MVDGFKGVQSCRRQLGTIAAVRDSKAPATITVLLEDTAATMGLLVGFLVICLGKTLHKLVLNGAAPVVISITLASVSLFLAIECKGLLVGESAKSLVVCGIRALEDARDGIFGVNELWTMHLGPEDLLVNISVDLADRLTSSDVEAEV